MMDHWFPFHTEIAEFLEWTSKLKEHGDTLEVS